MFDYRKEKPIDRMGTMLLALYGIYGALLSGAEGVGFEKKECEGLAMLVLMVALDLSDIEKEFSKV